MNSTMSFSIKEFSKYSLVNAEVVESKKYDLNIFICNSIGLDRESFLLSENQVQALASIVNQPTEFLSVVAYWVRHDGTAPFSNFFEKTLRYVDHYEIDARTPTQQIIPIDDHLRATALEVLRQGNDSGFVLNHTELFEKVS